MMINPKTLNSEDYVHIVRFYEGPPKTNSIYYDIKKSRLIGILKFPKEELTPFWKTIVNAGSNFFIEGTFYDYLSKEENKHWGDYTGPARLKYIAKNQMFIKTMIFPSHSEFILEGWAKRKSISNRKKTDAKKLLRNLFHYELHSLELTRKKFTDERYTMVIPKRLAESRFEEIARIIRFIPSTTVTIDPFFGAMNVSIDIKAMRLFCGFFVDREQRERSSKIMKTVPTFDSQYARKRIVIDYIISYGLPLSTALTVSDVIMKKLRGKELDIKDIQKELDYSKTFNTYEDLKEFRRTVRKDISDIMKNMNINQIAQIVDNAESIDNTFSMYFSSLDNNERYRKFYRKEFNDHVRERSVMV